MRHIIGGNLIFLIPLASGWAAPELEEALDPSLLDSESGIREIFIKKLPNFDAEFYFFDGEQIIGLFTSKEEPRKVLLLTVPSPIVDKLSFRVDGEKTEWKPHNMRFKFWVPDGRGDHSLKLTYEASIGCVSFFLEKDVSAQLEAEFRHPKDGGVRVLRAKRHNGDWEGSVDPRPEPEKG